MYRKDSGSMGFSFQRFANNAGASFMYDSTKDPGHISTIQKDLVFNLLTSRNGHNPKDFLPEVFSESGILDTEAVSKKVYTKLQKTSILSPEGRVDTRQIGPQFTHDLAIISVIRQKQIIDMMFWWEGEVERMEKFEQATMRFEEDLERARKEGDEAGARNAEGMVREMERLVREKPSLRTEGAHLGGGAGSQEERLPQYRGAGNQEEGLPQYQGPSS